MPAVATDVTVVRSVRPSERVCVTFIHPAKAFERNEVPFSRDIRVTLR